MDCLFDYYRGEFVSYDDWGGPGVEQSVDNGRKKKEMYSTYDIKTSEQMYRIAIQSFTVDTANPNNVGIWSLYIIKAEDDEDPYSAYRGDGKYTPGIHINIK